MNEVVLPTRGLVHYYQKKRTVNGEQPNRQRKDAHDMEEILVLGLPIRHPATVGCRQSVVVVVVEQPIASCETCHFIG